MCIKINFSTLHFSSGRSHILNLTTSPGALYQEDSNVWNYTRVLHTDPLLQRLMCEEAFLRTGSRQGLALVSQGPERRFQLSHPLNKIYPITKLAAIVAAIVAAIRVSIYVLVFERSLQLRMRFLNFA